MEKIMPEDVVLTEEVRTLYKDKNGKYYLSKQGAQEKLATHFPCKCGKGIREKFRIYCDSCEPPKKPEPFKEWDEKTPLFCSTLDKYFFDFGDLLDYIECEDLDKNDLVFYICEPQYYDEVDLGIWGDVMVEDQESLPDSIQCKLDELNKAIKDYGEPASWYPSKYRTKVNFTKPEPASSCPAD